MLKYEIIFIVFSHLGVRCVHLVDYLLVLFLGYFSLEFHCGGQFAGGDAEVDGYQLELLDVGGLANKFLVGRDNTFLDKLKHFLTLARLIGCFTSNSVVFEVLDCIGHQS